MDEPTDIRALRRKLESSKGPEYWRSLDELAGSPDFMEQLRREFPEGASEWEDSTGRRRFLKLMSASMVLAGVQGCISGPPQEDIVPYVDAPEEVVPGKPHFYATSFPFRGYGQGVLVESHSGRPTKVEGNPDHPASLGATNVFAQASPLDLYDQLRSTTPHRGGEQASWDRFLSELRPRLDRYERNGGEGLYLLTETVTSPTFRAQMQALLSRFPNAKWYRFDAVSTQQTEEGFERVFGRPVQPVYHLTRANTIVEFDSNFLFALPGSVRYAHDWAERRRIRKGATEMNRLYSIESTVSITGAMADHRLPLRPSAVEHVVRAVAARLGVTRAATSVAGVEDAWLEAVVDDLAAHAGSAVVIAGDFLAPELHVLIHRMNERLHAVGETVVYQEPVIAQPPGGFEPLSSLVAAAKRGRVDSLVMLGGNPAYAAPVDVAFEEALQQVPFSIHLSMHRDETSFRSTWHLPRTHYLETWSDIRAFDGTPGIIQPLIAPLYPDCRSDHELLSMLMGRWGVAGYEIVRTYWRGRMEGNFEEAWREALRLGVVAGASPELPSVGGSTFVLDTAGSRAERRRPEGSAAPRPDTTTSPDDSAAAPIDTTSSPADTAEARGDPAAGRDTELAPARNMRQADDENALVEIVFRPDPTIWDGRFATNGWLQELPKSITKLTWDNAALISPDLSERLGIEREQIVRLTVEGRSLLAAAWIVPGHPDHTVSLSLGYGRSVTGGGPLSRERYGIAPTGAPEVGSGFNAYLLRTSLSPWYAKAFLERMPESYTLVSTQHHHSMEGRPLVQEADIERFRENPDFLHEEKHELYSLYPEFDYPHYKWGMVIDTNTCIGCNACVIACQAENNIPIVGKEEVRRGREMHWLRIDRYYKGPMKNPEAFFQPVPCMHCEKAPCEVVCPVYATVHDSEGLNVMVYNRCIGTRYCSNNCPYKVRRFNFLQYADWDRNTQALQRNPDVTVRSRGVMEKCTYCQQRINAARIRAKKEDRTIRDGEMMTACQMACPTKAIVFGDLNDEAAEVHHLHHEPHNYSLLHHLGTRPRTTYLAHFGNPNRAVPKPKDVEFRIGQDEKIEVEVGRGGE